MVEIQFSEFKKAKIKHTKVTLEVARNVVKLYESGRTQTSIGRQLNLHPQTVVRVLTGEFRNLGDEFRVDRRREGPEITIFNPQSVPEYCSECGTLVYMPCLACQIRKLKEKSLK